MKTVAASSTDARAWQALRRFWAGVVVAAAVTAAVLALLGPPEQAPPMEAGARMPEAAGAAADLGDEQAVPAAGVPVAAQATAEATPRRDAAADAAAPAAGEPATAGSAGPAGALPAAEAATRRVAAALPQPALPPQLAALPPSPALPPAAALPGPPSAAALPPRPARPGPIPPPDPALLEPSRHGPLPRIAPDGTTPARFYARGFDREDRRPRIGILVGGIGLSARLAQEAIAALPPEVSLALSPYAPAPEPILAAARARGMETLVALPFEPQGWPLNDPGDRALLTGLPMTENLDRLFWALSRMGGQVGAVGALGPLLGERFAAQPGALEAVQRILASRGLLYVDPRPGAAPPGFAWGAAADLVLDDPPGAAAIEVRLAALERLAQQRGSALGYAGEASPVLVGRIAAWAEGLARRGAVLVPVSALIRRPEPR